MKNTTWIKIFVSCGGLLILLVRLIWPTIKIDLCMAHLILNVFEIVSSIYENAGEAVS